MFEPSCELCVCACVLNVFRLRKATSASVDENLSSKLMQFDQPTKFQTIFHGANETHLPSLCLFFGNAYQKCFEFIK